MGDWKNYGHFYPGKVIKCNGDGTYDIKYDDGYTERNVKLENVKDPDVPEAPEGVDPKDDAACELAADADNLANKISELGRTVSRYIAEKSSEDADAALEASEADEEARRKARKAAKEKARRDANDFTWSWQNRYSGWDWRSWSNRDDYWKKYKAEAEAKKAEIRGETPGPAPSAAPAAAPPGLEGREASPDLIDVKTEIIDVETEIHELEVQVADNDEKLREFRLGTKGDKVASSAAAAVSSAPTLDDLISAYRTRLEERKRRREDLKKVVEAQSKELESYSKGSENKKVTVDKLVEATKEVDDEVEKVWTKREKLIKDGRMDDELDHAIKQVKKDAKKVVDKVKEIEKAEKEAERAREFAKKVEEQAMAKLRAEQEKAREENRRLEEKLANADKRQEAEIKRQMEELEAKNAAEEAKVAEDLARQKANAEEAQKKLLKVSEAAEQEVYEASQKADNLNTGLTPSADKWWRYRYEWSYVEAGLMIWIVFLMLFWEFVFQRISGYVRGFIVGGNERLRMVMMATQGTVQEMWLRSFAERLFLCTLTFLTVWIMAKTGLWEYSPMLLNPRGGGIHLPHDVMEYRVMAIDLCAILFFAVVCYFLLALSMVRITEVLLQKLALECTNVLTPRSARERSVMTEVVAHAAEKVSWALVPLHYKNLRDAWRERVKQDDDMDTYMKAEFRKPEFDFLLYMRLSVKRKTEDFLDFGVFVWFLIVITFFVHLTLHLHFHIAYVRIMTFYLCLTICVLAAMTVSILNLSLEAERVLQEEEDEDMDPHQRRRSEMRMKNFEDNEWLFFSVLNYLLFMLCYGFARMVLNKWMWEMYFWNVVTVFFITLGLALFFTLVIAPLVPVFGALSALPPNLSERNTEMALLVAEGSMAGQQSSAKK